MSELINIESILADKSKKIPFDQLDPKSFTPTLLKLIANAKTIYESVADSATAADWNTVVEPIDNALEDLGYVWSVISHLSGVADSPQLRATMNEVLAPYSELYSSMAQNEKLYAKYKAIRQSEEFTKLSAARQLIIERNIRDFVLGGAELNQDDKAALTALNEKSAKISQKFSENLLDCTNAFALYLPEDTKELEGIPESDKALFAQQAAADNKKGFKLTLHMPSYLPVMQFASDRKLRKKIYHAYCTRASEFSAKDKDNAPLICDLLKIRKEEAKLLGYKNFGELSLVCKMADTPEQVVAFLRDLAAKAKPFAEKDMQELADFCKKELGIKKPKAWDYSFGAEKLRELKYAYSEQEVKQYFTEPTVIAGLFSLVQRLFGIKIKQAEAPVWHKDVKFYDVYNQKDEHIASFYADLYARNGKRGGAWMDDQASRRLVKDRLELPIAYLCCNFSAPVGDKPALLTMNDVETLFHEFGHGLHHMLTTQTDLSVSGINGVEWDAVEMPSQFMENFAWNWEVMQTITKHVESGQTMPRQLFDKLVASRNFEAGMATVRQIEFALFDMLIHTELNPKKDNFLDTLKAVRKEVAVVFPPKYNRFANSFSHIFAGGYAAGYYSYKWAEVLSADAFSLFEEQGIFNPEIGKRWLDEVLSRGGSRPAMDSFVAFRGRKPQVDALLKTYGMLPEQK